MAITSHDVPPELGREWLSEQERFLTAAMRILKRWPNYRQHIAYALLGSAIAFADTFGCDVERFLQEMRRTQTKPAPIGRDARSAS